MIERSDLIAECSRHLWRYLSQNAHKTPGPSGITALPFLSEADLDDVRLRMSLAVVQTIDPASAISAFQATLRNIPTSISFRDEDLAGRVKGKVDWTQTVLRRAMGSTHFACRIPERNSDLPINRALLSLINGYCRSLDVISARIQGGDSRVVSAAVRDTKRIYLYRRAISQLARHPKICALKESAAAEPQYVERLIRFGLDSRFLSQDLRNCLDRQPSPMGIQSLISRHYLSPKDSGALYEFLIAVRVVKALESLGARLRPLTLISSTKPFADLATANGEQYLVYWQRSYWALGNLNWSRPGRYESTMSSAGIGFNSLRPDLIVVGPNGRTVLVEAKYTDSDSGSRASVGVVEMFAYLHDIGDRYLGDIPPLGLVVAHGAEASGGAAPVFICTEDNADLKQVFANAFGLPMNSNGSSDSHTMLKQIACPLDEGTNE